MEIKLLENKINPFKAGRTEIYLTFEIGEKITKASLKDQMPILTPILLEKIETFITNNYSQIYNPAPRSNELFISFTHTTKKLTINISIYGDYKLEELINKLNHKVTTYGIHRSSGVGGPWGGFSTN